MLHPVGSLPPHVYWRRRLLLIGFTVLLILLIALTSYVACSPGTPAAAPATSSRPAASQAPQSPVEPATSSPPRSSASSSPVVSSTSTSPTPTHTAAPVACVASALKIAAGTSASSYPTGSNPALFLQVTNAGTVSCTQDLADKFIELRVYNGTSRVWGSHDCQTEPGSMVQTLAPNRPVRVQITWSGRSSQPECAGQRQLVGAGTYTLYALLNGQQGTAATFTLTQH